MREARGTSLLLVGLLITMALVLQGCPSLIPNRPPNAEFTANPTQGKVPLSVQFDASETSDPDRDSPDGDIVSYKWYFGDGNSKTGIKVVHTYNSSNTFTVTLTATDGQGASDQSSKEISVAGRSGDIIPPSLESFGFQPPSLDVTSGSKEVNFQIEATDNLSGIDKVRVVFDDPTGTTKQNRTGYGELSAGSTLDGTWEGSIRFPESVANGTWVIHGVVLRDNVGNYRSIRTSELIDRQFPTELDVVSNQDTNPPDLDSFTFSPSEIDTSDSSAKVEFSVEALDSLSGVEKVRVIFEDPTGTTQQNKTGYASLIAGTPSNGKWEGSLTFPQYGAEGTWKVHSVVIWDQVGNYQSFSTTELRSRGFPTQLEAMSNPDVVPPEVVAFDFDPKSIDTAQESQKVSFTVKATDNLSGVNKIRVTFEDPTGTTQQNRTGNANLRSGSVKDGTWQGEVNFPQHSAEGTWVVHSLVIWDSLGNYKSVRTESLKANNFPTELTNGL